MFRILVVLIFPAVYCSRGKTAAAVRGKGNLLLVSHSVKHVVMFWPGEEEILIFKGCDQVSLLAVKGLVHTAFGQKNSVVFPTMDHPTDSIFLTLLLCFQFLYTEEVIFLEYPFFNIVLIVRAHFNLD